MDSVRRTPEDRVRYDLRPRDITIFELTEFFAATNVSPSCTCCGNEFGSILSTNNAQFAQPVINNYAGTSAEGKFVSAPEYGSITFLVTECDRCSFLRYFSYYGVLHWLEKRKAK